MSEIIQSNQGYVCEYENTACALSCTAPDYVRREAFLNDSRKKILFESVAKSIISNLSFRTLETVDRDPIIICKTNVTDLTCFNATLSAFSRDELGAFFAKETVMKIGRIVRGEYIQPPMGEDLYISECLERMKAQSVIKKGGNIDGKELFATIKWYFSGDGVERAPKGADKYIDLEKIEKNRIQDSGENYTFNTYRYKNPSITNIRRNENPVSTVLEQIVILTVQGKSKTEIAEALGISQYTLRIDTNGLLRRFNVGYLQQAIFQMVEKKEIDYSVLVNGSAISAISGLNSDELNLLNLITDPLYYKTVNSVSNATIFRYLNSIYSKIGVTSRTEAGVAYLAYKQSCVQATFSS